MYFFKIYKILTFKFKKVSYIFNNSGVFNKIQDILPDNLSKKHKDIIIEKIERQYQLKD